MVQLYAPEGGQAELRPLNLQTPGHGDPRSRGPVDIQRNNASTKVDGGSQDENNAVQVRYHPEQCSPMEVYL